MPKQKLSPQQKANLRCCASCYFIFKITDNQPPVSTIAANCPMCAYGGTYGARFMYGKDTYKFAKYQKPFLDRKMEEASRKWQSSINEYNECVKKSKRNQFSKLLNI
jgi:hypothetical protein